MANLVFREEVISLSYPSEHPILLTDSTTDCKILDWCQAIYVQTSVLICKVYSSTLHLTQFFLSCPTQDSYTLTTHESPCQVKICFPGAILPKICYKSDPAEYSLFVLTAESKLFRLTFYQDSVFTKEKVLKDMQGYNIGKTGPSCLSLIEVYAEEFEVCIGLKNGTLVLESFLISSQNEFIEPDRSKVVEVPLNLIKKFKKYMFQTNIAEEVLRTAVIGEQLILTLNNYGVLRLYDLSQHKYISELELEIGKILDYKFSTFFHTSSFFLAFAYSKREHWFVYLIKIINTTFEIISQFTDPGILFELSLNQDGLWMAWGSFRSSKIVLKSFEAEDPIVYSAFDEMQTQNLEDEIVLKEKKNSKSVIDRVLLTGRFHKDWVLQGVKKVLNSGVEDLDNLHLGVNPEQAAKILEYVKGIDVQSKEIWGLGMCDLPGGYFVVVIRGNEKIGVMRRVESELERAEVRIRKLAAEWSFLRECSVVKDFSKFKLTAGVSGLDLCLVVIRIWRLGFGSTQNLDMKKYLKRILVQHIPNSLLQVLKRALPSDVDTQAHIELSNFSKLFSDYTEKNSDFTNEYWPKSCLNLFGNFLISLVRSHFDYFFDLTLLLLLFKSQYTDELQTLISDSAISDCTSVSLYLFSLLHTLTSPLQLSNSLSPKNSEFFTQYLTTCSNFQQYSFPVTVSTLYIYSRSTLILGNKYTLELYNSVLWFSNSLSLTFRDLLNACCEESAFRNPDPKIEKCLKGRLLTSINLLTVLSFFGQNEAIQRFYECLDSLEGLRHFFEGKALLKQLEKERGEKKLVRSVAAFVSGTPETDFEKLIACPVSIEAQGDDTNVVSLYLNGLSGQIDDCYKRNIVLTDFIQSSLSATFTENKLQSIVSALIEVSSYSEALTITASLCNEKQEILVLKDVIEDSMKKNCFSSVLSLPFMCKYKEKVIKMLKDKSVREEFDVYRTILRDRYYEEGCSLFLDEFRIEDRQLEREKGQTWTEALYSCCTRFGYFSSAASAAYSSFLQAELQLNRMQKGSNEYRFIKKIVTEYLLLASVSARCINPSKKNCFFLVPTLKPSTLESTPKLVRLKIAHSTLTSQLSKYLTT